MRHKLLSILLLALLGIFPLPTKAQETLSAQPLYSPTTPEYLAKAYWLMGNLDLKKDTHIDQYLMITECTLYTQFFSNDFEWAKIRQATRDYIKANKESFSPRFEFIQPIMLGRYNEVDKGFEIQPGYQMIGIKKLQVSNNGMDHYPCLDSPGYNNKEFPINAVLNLSRPFDYTFVKADRAQADEYLKYLEDNKVRTDQGRPAYIRFRFKVQQSFAPTYLDTGTFGNFYGTMEAISIFGDRELFIKFDERKY